MTTPPYEPLPPLDVPLGEFLGAFHNGPYCLRSFPDRGEGRGHNLTLTREQLDAPKTRNQLTSLNRQHQGIFFVVNPGGHKDGAITGVAAHFVEADELPLTTQWDQLQAFSLAPSIIVKTRKSLHAYWLLNTTENQGPVANDPINIAENNITKDTSGTSSHQVSYQEENIDNIDDKSGELSQFTTIQKRLAAHLGGDPVISNLSRVMRLPGFDHCKADPVAVSCLKFDPQLRYAQKELVGALPKIAPPPTNKPAVPGTAGKTPEPRLMMKHCAFLAHAREAAPSLPEPLWYAMITLLGDLPGGVALIHELSRDYPGYSPTATDAKIRHFLNSGARSVSCRTLEDWGYRCPKLGTCAAASPRELGIPPLPPWYEKGRQGLRFKPGILANELTRSQRVFFSGEAYYRYLKGVYREVSDHLIKKLIRRQLIPEHATMAQINDVLGQWTVEVSRENGTLNRDKGRINIKNGLLDLATGTLSPHDPTRLTTIQLATAFDPKAQAPRFNAFLNDCLDPQTQGLVSEIIGYLLIPETCAQKAFVFVGEGGAGKSTLLTVAQEALLGRRNVSNIPWQSLGERFKTAELFGKLANIFADLPLKSIDDNGLFKSITGDDVITAERKNRDPFAFRPTARLLFSCNEIPRNLGDRGEAFYRRLVIVPFLPPKPPTLRDPHLKAALMAEAPGILNWALAGLKRLSANDFRFSVSPQSHKALTDYRIAGSSVLCFVEELCRLEPGRQTGATTLYCAYSHFCSEGGLRPVSQKRFWTELKGAYPEVEKFRENSTRRAVYSGIALLDFDEVA